jgi:hypothetical protein
MPLIALRHEKTVSRAGRDLSSRALLGFDFDGVQAIEAAVNTAARLRVWSLLALGLQGACMGDIGATDAEDGVGPAPSSGSTGGTANTSNPANATSPRGPAAGAPTPTIDLPTDPASSVVRMLSRRELGNAIEALVGFRPTALGDLPADKHDLVYDRVVEAQTVSSLHEDAFESIADQIADGLLAKELATVAPACAPKGTLAADGAALGASRRPCIEAFVDAIAPRAYRRALAADERAALLDLYDKAMSYRDGARQVVHGIFRSPSFLYLIEYGKATTSRDVLALSDDEVAARLSFGLCETVPDDGLRAAAAAGKLRDADGIAREAQRLLGLPCAKTTVRSFWSQWLRLARLDGLTRDAKKYPTFTAAGATAMQRESERFLDYVTWDAAGSLRDVVGARYSILDSAIAPFYGVSGLGTDPKLTNLPAERRGILTQPSVLAITSDMDASSPIKRGVYVMEGVLCQKLPERPQNLAVTTPATNDAVTTRARWEQHSSNPACSFCHRALDPVGFAMEDFDAVGRHRTVENGHPVDASGGIPALGVADGSVTGAAALSDVIADRAELATCFARQWLRFTLGRMEAASDVAALQAIVAPARTATLRDALLALVRSDQFRQRPRSN